MIVRDEDVEVALAYLNERPHPLSRALLAATTAENRCKRAFALAFMAATGSVEQRKATAELDADYVAAKVMEADAIEQLQDLKERKNGAEFIIECWRTEQSNIRAAERIR